MDTATVLEEAADLLLMDGWCQRALHKATGERCALGALGDASPAMFGPEYQRAHVVLHDEAVRKGFLDVVDWNNAAETDQFEVIDTLRRLAKDIRNGAVPA